MTAPELRALRYNYLTSLAVSRAGPYRDGLAMAVREIEARLRRRRAMDRLGELDGEAMP